MPEPTRQPLLTEGQVRLAFIGSGIGMVALLVLLLILTTARPQGQYSPADTSQYDATLERAASDLDGYRLLEGGRATIDIERAMDLVAERGVGLSLTAASVPAEEVAAEEAPADAESADDGATDSADEAPAESADGAEASETAEEAEPEADAATDDATDTGTEDPAADTEGEETAAEEPAAQAAPERSYDAALGEETYANCVSCHQADGQGVPGAFPPLAEWMPEVVAVDGGKDYYAQVLLWGLQGQIEVGGQSYNGVMPGWQQLSDAQIAAVLNHELMSWGNDALLPDDFELYTPDDIAALRTPSLSPNEVLEVRQSLDLP